MAPRKPQPARRGKVKKPRQSDPRSNGHPTPAQIKELRNRRTGDSLTSSWKPNDLAAILAGERLEDSPTMLKRSDGPCLIYGAKVHAFAGEPETGKGWLALFACAEQLNQGQHIIYADFEGEAAAAVERLRALGVDDSAIKERFHYLRPDEPIGESAWEELDPLLADEPAIVVFDGMTDALAVHGIDLIDNTAIAKWLRKLPRAIARLGPAVVLIDHVAKNQEGPRRYQIGAQHKLAGIDVAYMLKVRTSRPLGRGMTGEVTVTVEKDRPGHVRPNASEGKYVATMEARSTEGGAKMTIALEPMGERPKGGYRPAGKMVAVSGVLETNPGLTKNAVIDAVGGNKQATAFAIELLENEGHIEVRKGPRNSQRHYLVEPFDGDNDEG